MVIIGRSDRNLIVMEKTVLISYFYTPPIFHISYFNTLQCNKSQFEFFGIVSPFYLYDDILFFWFNWYHMISWYLSISTVKFSFKLIMFFFHFFDDSFLHTIYTYCNSLFDFSFLFCSVLFCSVLFCSTHLSLKKIICSSFPRTMKLSKNFPLFYFFIFSKCNLMMNFFSIICIANSSSCQRFEANGDAHLIRNKKHNVRQLIFLLILYY